MTLEVCLGLISSGGLGRKGLVSWDTRLNAKRCGFTFLRAVIQALIPTQTFPTSSSKLHIIARVYVKGHA